MSVLDAVLLIIAAFIQGIGAGLLIARKALMHGGSR